MTSKPKILVVDDDSAIATTLALILNHHGSRAPAVFDGETAVSIARAWKPDIFISDVVMPGMNGYEAGAQITVLLPDCRVLLFSAHFVSAESVLHDTDTELQFAFLPKPVHPAELLNKLHSLMGTRSAAA